MTVVNEVEIADPLVGATLEDMLAYWDAANYLTAAQIYLLDDPLLREPLRAEHIKPRLLGWSAFCSVGACQTGCCRGSV